MMMVWLIVRRCQVNDVEACTFDPNATEDDESCDYLDALVSAGVIALQMKTMTAFATMWMTASELSISVAFVVEKARCSSADAMTFLKGLVTVWAAKRMRLGFAAIVRPTRMEMAFATTWTNVWVKRTRVASAMARRHLRMRL